MFQLVLGAEWSYRQPWPGPGAVVAYVGGQDTRATFLLHGTLALTGAFTFRT